jgi:hypothetical protein
VKSPAVKSAKPGAVEPAAMKSAAAVETPAASASVRCLSNIRLGEDGRAQQRGRNARHTPPLLGLGSAISQFAHRPLLLHWPRKAL